MENKDCPLCKAVVVQNNFDIYEDDFIKAVLLRNACELGHMLIFPKQHYTIIEQVPEQVVSQMFIVANKLSTAAFEALGVQGTNIIVNNGIAAKQEHPHFSVNVIPRKQDDGLNLEWQPKKVAPDELANAASQLKYFIESGSAGSAAQPVASSSKAQSQDSGDLSDQENYLIKQLKRIP